MKQYKSGTKDRWSFGRRFSIGLFKWVVKMMLIGAGSTESASMLDGATHLGYCGCHPSYPCSNLIDNLSAMYHN